MQKGEIWLIKLDSSIGVGHEYQNNRPALIIVSDSLISKINVVTIMPLTSSGKKYKDDVLIKKDSSNNLLQDSIIKTNHIMSYDKARFMHKIGKVDSAIIDKVEKYLKKHFNL